MEIRKWKTEDEIRYLNSIGTNRKERRGTLCKMACLKRYQKAMESRVSWGDMSPTIIRDYVINLLSSHTKKCKKPKP